MMIRLLIKTMTPLVPQISRSWNKTHCRLCSNERYKNGKESDTLFDDRKINNDKAQLSLSTEEVSTETEEVSTETGENQFQTLSLSSKYTSFNERDAPVILDVEEERIAAQQAQVPKDPLEEVFSRISMSHGEEGVFDLHEIVEVLKLCRAKQLCVLAVPKEARYADYMCIVTGKSNRHMLAIAEFVRRVYKQKKKPIQYVPKIEGKNCRNWMALDLDNIIVHIFSESAREVYDLENLWAVGSDFDQNSIKKEDSLVSLLQRHSVVLGNLHPADQT